MSSSEVFDEVFCNNGNCGYSFGAYPNGMENELEQRTPCPRCGSTARHMRKGLAAQLTHNASLTYDAYPPGQKSKRRRFAWGFTGWELSVKLGRPVRKESHFDKRGDRRYEHIEDPETGATLHHQDHPLTEHRGHGSAKFANKPTTSK